MPALQILFFIDEHLPVRELGRILRARGHSVQAVNVGFKDPSIIVTADQVGAVIVTADTWFLRELFRYPASHRKQYLRAGVIQEAGEWGAAKPRIERYLPVIEVTYEVRSAEVDRRLGIDLSGAMIHIFEWGSRR